MLIRGKLVNGGGERALEAGFGVSMRHTGGWGEETGTLLSSLGALGANRSLLWRHMYQRI